MADRDTTKKYFHECLFAANAIVTELQDPYPVNDTSVFTLSYVMTSFFVHELMGIQGYFWINSDTLNDFWKLEVSFDQGMSWIDLTNDSVIQNYFLQWKGSAGYDVLPLLSGNSNGWQWFDVNLYFLYTVNNQQYGDTSLYRFTFISDGIQSNKDGLMFDDLACYNGTLLAVPEMENGFSSSAFPNPATEFIHIHFENEKNSRLTLQLFDFTGNEILNEQNISGTGVDLKLNSLPYGMYIYKIVNSGAGNYSSGKFVKD